MACRVQGLGPRESAAIMFNESQVNKAVAALLKFVAGAPETLLEEDELLYLVRDRQQIHASGC